MIVRKVFSMILILLCLTGFAQRFKSDSSYIRFFSDAPMEDIKAINESASSIIELKSKAIVIVAPIKTFSFDKKLMQEHFNENYLESDQFPNATFKGKILKWGGEIGQAKATAKGTLEIHGVKQEVIIEGDIIYAEDKISLSATFPIKLSDYEIKIPKAVFYKIAEEVEVTAKFEYVPYEKN